MLSQPVQRKRVCKYTKIDILNGFKSFLIFVYHEFTNYNLSLFEKILHRR